MAKLIFLSFFLLTSGSIFAQRLFIPKSPMEMRFASKKQLLAYADQNLYYKYAEAGKTDATDASYNRAFEESFCRQNYKRLGLIPPTPVPQGRFVDLSPYKKPIVLFKKSRKSEQTVNFMIR